MLRRLLEIAFASTVFLAVSASFAFAQTPRSAECGSYLQRSQQSRSGGSVQSIIGTIGRIAGQAFGKQTGIGEFTLLGGQVGQLVGGQLAAALDPCERDQAAIATKQALDSDGQGDTTTQTWTSNTNKDRSGASTVTRRRVRNDGRQCKIVRQVGYVGGGEIVQNVEYCQTANGGWEPKQA